MLCEVPLTKEQQAFATDHHGLVYKFLNENHLPEDEFYDVVVFAYLKAVKGILHTAVGLALDEGAAPFMEDPVGNLHLQAVDSAGDVGIDQLQCCLEPHLFAM